MNDTDKTSQVTLIDFSEPISEEQDVIKEKLKGEDWNTAVFWIIIYIYLKLKAMKTFIFSQLLAVN